MRAGICIIFARVKFFLLSYSKRKRKESKNSERVTTRRKFHRHFGVRVPGEIGGCGAKDPPLWNVVRAKEARGARSVESSLTLKPSCILPRAFREGRMCSALAYSAAFHSIPVFRPARLLPLPFTPSRLFSPSLSLSLLFCSFSPSLTRLFQYSIFIIRFQQHVSFIVWHLRSDRRTILFPVLSSFLSLRRRVFCLERSMLFFWRNFSFEETLRGILTLERWIFRSHPIGEI